MNKISRLPLILLVLFASSCSKETPIQEKSLNLWYNKPADVWEATLPLGNGRLGAMPDGGVVNEKIVLNEISLWSGSPQDADMKDAYLYLPQIQEYLRKGENIEAQELMNKYFKCKGKGTAFGNGADTPYGSYQILANLNIKYEYGTSFTDKDATDYKRELSLNEALAKTSFNINNVNYQREYFTSFNNDVIIIRLSE